MEQLAAQDGAAFEHCYGEYRTVVYEGALRMVGNHDEAEDIAQQVFMRVWSKPSAFRGGNFAAWLTTVTHNLCIDHLRRRRPILMGDAAADVFLSRRGSGATVEDEVIREMTASSIRDAMRFLKPHELTVILASFMADQTHHQIARAAALPLGTVKTRIRSGLRRLRQSAAGLQ
ncbi:MAG: RNA polymerase sigma factor [Candidatus Baltobacteraceae bacterium]